MFRILTTVLALGALSTPALADDHAEYGASLGFSPFGGSVSLGWHTTASTTFFATFGGAPEGEAPFKIDVDGTEYTQKGGSSWMGIFMNHRPFDDSQWFRFSTGIGIGGIYGELSDGNGNKYDVEYKENPVGYMGVGFGNGTSEGITFGFDLGALYGSGPEITVAEGNGNDLEGIEDSSWFGNVLPNLQFSVGYNF